MMKHYFPVRITMLKELRRIFKNLGEDTLENISSQRTSFRDELWYEIKINYESKFDVFSLVLSCEETPEPFTQIFTISKLKYLREKVDNFIILQEYKWNLQKRMSKGK